MTRIASSRILRHARGQPCCLRFVGICNGNPETTVAAHIRDSNKGMGQKASDYSVIYACSACHVWLDEHFIPERAELFYWHTIRGLQETWGILIRDGIIVIPLDAETLSSDRPTKPRKPKSQRARVQTSTRPIPSRKFNSTGAPNVRRIEDETV